jgi:hypothetical protein
MLPPVVSAPTNQPTLTRASPSQLSDETEQDDSEQDDSPEPPPNSSNLYLSNEHGSTSSLIRGEKGFTVKSFWSQSSEEDEQEEDGECVKTLEVRSGAQERATGKHDCFDVEAKALFDTGTKINMVSPKFMERLRLQEKTYNYIDGVKTWRISASDRDGLYTFNDQPVPLKSKVRLDFKPRDCQEKTILRALDNKVQWQVLFYVSENSFPEKYDMIIGRQTMRKCMQSKTAASSVQSHPGLESKERKLEVDGVEDLAFQRTIKGEAAVKGDQVPLNELGRKKNGKGTHRIISRIKKLVMAPFKKKNRLGYVLVNEWVRPRAKGPEGNELLLDSLYSSLIYQKAKTLKRNVPNKRQQSRRPSESKLPLEYSRPRASNPMERRTPVLLPDIRELTTKVSACD